MQTTTYAQNEIHRLSEGSWDALCALKRSPSCPSADHALRRQRSLHDSNNCASSSPCSCNTIQSHLGELYAMASSNTASVPRSREQSIMDESIDFSQYEEQDAAVNKHLGAGRASGSNGHAAGYTTSRSTDESGSSSSLNTNALSEEDALHIRAIEQAMASLKQLDMDKDWDKVSTHEKRVTVHVKKSVVNVSGKQKKVPLFRGELFIRGFTPEQVFEVVGRRSLWDDWYDSGNLVADLNNSTSMTYMNMHVPGTARPRDVSLIERVEATSDGTIWFAATSIETSKVPHVHGRTRAQMVLNGWILKPFEQNGHPGTWCCYYLQIDPQGLSPFPLATKMVSKRLSHIYKIEEYLKKHGQPRSAGTGQTNRKAANGQAAAGAAILSHSNGDARSGTDTSGQDTGSSLPPQAPFDDNNTSAKAVLQARQKVEQLLSNNVNWDKAVDPQGNPLYTQDVSGSSLPIMKGEARMPTGVTTEQVLGTMLSASARRIWNEHLQSTQLLESISGTEQCIRKDTYKGIHPHLPSRTYTLAQGVFRSDISSDNGDIVCVSTSTSANSSDASEDSGNVLRSTLDYAGWKIHSSTSGQVEIVNAIKINLEKENLPEFVKRILTFAYAGAPAKVAECIKEYGHAPYFLRWSPGKATFDGEIEGDLETGRFGWKITAKGKAAHTTTTEQLVWLQYSSTMYPNGIALQTSGSSESIKAAKVEGYANTIQLTFTSSLPEGGLTLESSRNRGNSPQDMSWNGQALSQTVTPPRGTNSLRTETASNTGVLAATRSGAQKEMAPVPVTQPQQNSHQTSATQAQLAKVTEVATDLTTVRRVPVDSKGRRQWPDDAMLILTQDLYFTRSQMGLILILLLLVWSAARYL